MTINVRFEALKQALQIEKKISKIVKWMKSNGLDERAHCLVRITLRKNVQFEMVERLKGFYLNWNRKTKLRSSFVGSWIDKKRQFRFNLWKVTLMVIFGFQLFSFFPEIFNLTLHDTRVWFLGRIILKSKCNITLIFLSWIFQIFFKMPNMWNCKQKYRPLYFLWRLMILELWIKYLIYLLLILIQHFISCKFVKSWASTLFLRVNEILRAGCNFLLFQTMKKWPDEGKDVI